MKFNIYDYDNEAVEVETDASKVVLRLDINVVSGDEIVDIIYSDGSRSRVDSSDRRCINYNDGYYSISREAIGKWIAAGDEAVNRGENVAYWRMECDYR